MNAYWGGEWSASRSCRFTPPVPIGQEMDPRAILDDTEERTLLTVRALEL
jgi:hypothetical protein